MAFYVPLGPRGLLFRIGTFVIGIWEAWSTGRLPAAVNAFASNPSLSVALAEILATE